MNYHATMIKSDEGYAVSCPALRGCHSQGDTSAEALGNIREAIREWLAAEQDEPCFTLGSIAADACLTPAEFRRLLCL